MNLQKLKKIGVSYSRLSTFLRCKRLFWYTINNWYNPTSNINKNTLFGNLCHHLLEHFISDKTATVDFLLQGCDQYVKENPKSVGSVDEQEIIYQKSLSAVTMFSYIKLYHQDETVLSVLNRYKILKNELYLRRLNINGFVFNIKIDKVLQHKETGEIWILDHKCKGRFNLEILNKKLNIDKQLYLYAKAFEIAYKKPVKGIIQDVIRKPQLRRGKKETINDFYSRVFEDIMSRPSHYFTPLLLPLNTTNKDTFNSDIENIMNDVYTRMGKGESAFIQDGAYSGQCEDPYTCEFLDACVSESMGLYLKNF